MKYTCNKTKEIVFPLGGIGTGSVGLGGDGRLKDWEIFNRPNKGSDNGYTHFAIRSIDDDKITAAVLNGDINKDLIGQYKQLSFTGYGFNPYKTGDFKCIWSLGSGWGEFEIKDNKVRISVIEGSIKLKQIGLAFAKKVNIVKTDEKQVDFKFNSGIINFDEIVITDSIEILM